MERYNQKKHKDCDCKKCGAIEPHNWDDREMGQWQCDCRPKKRDYKVEDILEEIYEFWNRHGGDDRKDL